MGLITSFFGRTTLIFRANDRIVEHQNNFAEGVLRKYPVSTVPLFLILVVMTAPC